MNLVAPLDLSVFQHTYQHARSLFLQTLEPFSQTYIAWQNAYKHPLKGAENEALFCDVALLSRTQTPKQILVIQSATHGIEGYMGSAVQTDLLAQLKTTLDAHPEFGVLMIHALNPWGFSWQRRGDHQNIDLNRNFVDFSKPLPQNPDYDCFAQDALRIWQNRHRRAESIASFLGPVSQGQYHTAAGIFYGGTAPTWSNRLLHSLAKEAFWATAEKISVIDLHTGLGSYGYGELINDHSPQSVGFENVVTTYGANACSAYLGEACSKPKTGLVDFFWHNLIGERGHFVTLEFGTFAAEALVGLLLEEQNYQNHLGQRPRDLQASEVKALLHFFYPFEVSWQQQILFRSRQVTELAISQLLHA